MRRQLLGSLSLFEVPKDITYFRNGSDYLVINPEVAARILLTGAEFAALQALIAQSQGKSSPSLPDNDATERTLAKFILSWLVYYNGNRPTVGVKEAPLNYAYYAITEGCNLRCPYCYASSEKRLNGELNTAESLDLVSQIAAFGGHTIVFTGGEPMLRRDLFEVVEHANSLGLKSNIITNATMIRKPETAERFAELFGSVTISLDGATAKSHDRTRGKGAFARTHRALELLNAAGVEPAINHIVTSDNVEELVGFAEFLDGIKVHSIRLMNHNDLGRGANDDYDFGWTDHLRVQQIVWSSPAAGALKPDGPKPASPCSVKGNCGLGGNEIYINSVGDVYPCKLVTAPEHRAGNIREKSLAEVFASPVLGAMRRSTVFGGEFHDDCSKCYIKAECGGGCRAAHMSESGDLRSNSRHLCRILRHGVVTQLWREAGLSRAEIAANDQAMTVPRLVATDEVHEVFDQWKTYEPSPQRVAKINRLLPLTPIQRRSDVEPAHS